MLLKWWQHAQAASRCSKHLDSACWARSAMTGAIAKGFAYNYTSPMHSRGAPEYSTLAGAQNSKKSRIARGLLLQHQYTAVTGCLSVLMMQQHDPTEQCTASSWGQW